jgi:hypothetical protein
MESSSRYPHHPKREMQEVLTAMSSDDQFKVADLLSKYEDTVTALTKVR